MTKSPSPRPLSIKIISRLHLYTSPIWICGGIWLASAFRELIEVLEFPDVYRLNVFFVTGSCYAVAFLGLAGVVLAIGLWRLNDLARRATIICQGLWIALYLFFLFFAGPLFRIYELYGEVGPPVGYFAIPFLLSFVIVWFLITRKSAFIGHKGGKLSSPVERFAVALAALLVVVVFFELVRPKWPLTQEQTEALAKIIKENTPEHTHFAPGARFDWAYVTFGDDVSDDLKDAVVRTFSNHYVVYLKKQDIPEHAYARFPMTKDIVGFIDGFRFTLDVAYYKNTVTVFYSDWEGTLAASSSRVTYSWNGKTWIVVEKGLMEISSREVTSGAPVYCS